MENLEIEETEESLSIRLQVNGELTFSGRSYPEDSNEFFTPVLDWLDRYKNNPSTKTVANFDISYYSSTSALYLLRLLNALVSIHRGGNEVLVVWNYAKNDELMLQRGEELSSMVNLPFKLVAR